MDKLLIALVAVLLLLFPARVEALGKPVPPLDEFIAEVMNGEGDELRGIYAPGVFAYSVVPQPVGDDVYVSTREDAVTQFGLAYRYDSTGLLAHNFLAGKRFHLLKTGQVLYLIYGDGRTEPFVVSRLLRFQALVPDSVTGHFVDLESGQQLSTPQLFFMMYDKGNLVLQTCIWKDGDNAWGRLFIIAEPVPPLRAGMI